MTEGPGARVNHSRPDRSGGRAIVVVDRRARTQPRARRYRRLHSIRAHACTHAGRQRAADGPSWRGHACARARPRWRRARGPPDPAGTPTHSAALCTRAWGSRSRRRRVSWPAGTGRDRARRDSKKMWMVATRARRLLLAAQRGVCLHRVRTYTTVYSGHLFPQLWGRPGRRRRDQQED